jgi:hypothetical protein
MIYLAPQVGLEPTTLRLTAECSAIELLRSVQAGNFATAPDFTANPIPRVKTLSSHPAQSSSQVPGPIFDHCLRGSSAGGQRALDRRRFAVVPTHVDASRSG